MKTSSAKAKGRRAAQLLRDIILASFPQLQGDDIIVTSSGDTGEDLKLSPAARAVLPLTFECKNVESLNIWAALKQAAAHAETTQYVPALAFKRNLTDLFVAVPAVDFFRLVRRREE